LSNPPAWIEKFWADMNLTYPGTWQSQFTDKAQETLAKHKWADTLLKNKIFINRAVINNLHRTHPTFPPKTGEWLAMCEEQFKKQSGIPDMQEALILVTRREFTHPIVRAAFEKMNTWDLAHDSQKELLQKFIPAYEKAWDELYGSPSSILEATATIKMDPLPMPGSRLDNSTTREIGGLACKD
jgi:hypothetical protein